MKRFALLILCLVMLVSIVGCNYTDVCHSPCDICGKCTNAQCTRPACQQKCEGHDQPHTCENVCEICGKCTNVACIEEACLQKCTGHSSQHTCSNRCEICGKCNNHQCTDEVCQQKCEGHDDPHTCENVCDLCGKCTNSQCTYEACRHKCPGHNDTTSFYFDYTIEGANEKFYEDFSAEEKQLYYTLWEPTTSISIKMDISSYELAKIDEAFQDYSHGDATKADTYRKCNLIITVNGTEYYYEEVGVRMRGNTSRRDFTNDQGQMHSFIHFRFNLTETFDSEEYAQGTWGNDIYHDWSNDEDGRKERKSRTFATMEKFYYKWNKNYDNTYIREVYANKMFQAYGILAPHITLTQLSVLQNGKMESIGVGGLYEVIDKDFIKRYLDKDNKGGDLYKCTYTSKGKADLTDINGRYGVETPTQTFSYDLKTNNDREDPDYHHNAYLKALVNTLATSKNDSQFVANLESIVDMEYFARFEAVNYLLGNPDCIKNNSNNYYLYFTPDCRAIFIPYDYDRCLGINMDWNPSGDGMISVKPFTTNSPNGGVSNPLYLKTILSGGLAQYQQMYKGNLQQVLDGDWFTYQHFVSYYNSYSANYSSLAKPSQAIVNTCGGSIRMDRFFFSLDGSSNFGSTSENISVQDYMQGKRQTALNNINNI